MSKMTEALEGLKSQIISIANRIEDSPQFEKVTLQFEALDPRYQKRIKAAATIAGIGMMILLASLPILSVFLKKNANSNFQNLISDMQSFNSSSNVSYVPAPRPLGWSPLPSATLDDIEASLNQFFALNGVPIDFTKVTKSGFNLTLAIEQISILQTVNTLFQLDGWFPALKFSNLSIKVNNENPQLLNLEAELVFNAEEGLKLNQTLGNLGGAGGNTSASSNNGIPSSQENNGDPSSTPPSNDYDIPAPPPPSNDDFGGGDLPPPPPFEEDI